MKLSDCFFLFAGLPLEVRKRRDRRSPPPDSFVGSFGGLLAVICWRSLVKISDSAGTTPSLPELSFFHSPLRSI